MTSADELDLEELLDQIEYEDESSQSYDSDYNSDSDDDFEDLPRGPVKKLCACLDNLGHFPDHRTDHDVFTPTKTLAFTVPILINELEGKRPVSQSSLSQVVWFIKALKREGIESIVRIDARGLLNVPPYPGMPYGHAEIARDYFFISSPNLEVTRYTDYCHGDGQITHVEFDYERHMSLRDVQIFMANLLDHGAHCDIISEVSPVTGQQPVM